MKLPASIILLFSSVVYSQTYVVFDRIDTVFNSSGEITSMIYKGDFANGVEVSASFDRANNNEYFETSLQDLLSSIEYLDAPTSTIFTRWGEELDITFSYPAGISSVDVVLEAGGQATSSSSNPAHTSRPVRAGITTDTSNPFSGTFTNATVDNMGILAISPYDMFLTGVPNGTISAMGGTINLGQVNNTMTVDFPDYSGSNLGFGISFVDTTIPEPSSSLLFLMGSFSFVLRRKR